MKKQIKLSKQEKNVLIGYKHGYKSSFIAEYLDINEKTISTYKARIKKKLGLKADDNDYLMVVTAIKKEFIKE